MAIATPEEQREFLPSFAKMLRSSFRTLPAAEQQHVVEQLRNLKITVADMQRAAQ
jgi:hypothetical protein